MKKKYYILVLTFLCMLCGQMGYATDTFEGDELDEVVISSHYEYDVEFETFPCYSSTTFTRNKYSDNTGELLDSEVLSYSENPIDCLNDEGEGLDECDENNPDYAGDCYCKLEGCDEEPEPITEEKDPCADKSEAESKANSIPINTQANTEQALKSTSAIDGVEHGITYGRDVNGLLTQAPMENGGIYNVPVNQNWPGAFAAVHNHVVDYPPSAGDVYTAITLISNNPNFTTSYINLPNGSSYAIVVTNSTLAQNFATIYPKDQINNNPPEFPDVIFNELQDLVTTMTSSLEGRINAIVATLDKYNSGITILKKDSSNGNYVKIAIKQTSINGLTTYQLINCP